MPGEDNIKPHRFKPGQSGNPEGRPKKRYKEHISDVRKKGYAPPTREEYFEMMGLLLSMTEDDLRDFAEDKERPFWIRLIIIDLKDKRNRQKIMSDYRDWLFGKGTERHEVSVNPVLAGAPKPKLKSVNG